MLYKYPLAFLSILLAATSGLAGNSLHPDSSGEGWRELFQPDLHNAIYPKDVWAVEDGILTATEDQAIWSSRIYDNFTLDLEFKTATGTNSGVIIYVSDLVQWIPNSVEIQIADDYAEKWAKAPASWRCGAFFGHKAAAREEVVRKAGEWNRMTVIAKGKHITVILNDEKVNEIDLNIWTSGTTTPDGEKIPPWLSTPWADLPTYGHIGFQGKHGDAPIWFRNVRVKVD